MSEPVQRGIITLADSFYFPGAKALSLSVAAYCPVTIYDLGLSEEDKLWVSRTPGVNIRPIPESTLIKAIRQECQEALVGRKASKREWPLWICPELIIDAPYEDVFWIDSDAIVLRNLDTMFERLQEKVFVTEENFAPEVTDNPNELYHYLPLQPGIHNIQRIRVNAGVSGWKKTRDRKVLEDYRLPVYKVFVEKTVPKSAISWHDQGSLIWALQNNGFTQEIVQSSLWNCCVKNTCLIDEKIKAGYADQELQQFINQCKANEPEVAILHWNGCPVPWS